VFQASAGSTGRSLLQAKKSTFPCLAFLAHLRHPNNACVTDSSRGSPGVVEGFDLKLGAALLDTLAFRLFELRANPQNFLRTSNQHPFNISRSGKL
jgi:hypothetical protein